MLRIFYLTVILTISARLLFAQGQITSYIDLGHNQVTNVFSNLALLGSYQMSPYSAEAGLQFSLKQQGQARLSSMALRVERKFQLKKLGFGLRAFGLVSPFAKGLVETNWGIVATAERRHFEYQLGTNFRAYSFTPKAKADNQIPPHSTMHEDANLMYLVKYWFKPIGHSWNVGLGFTNIDNFMIRQETNPTLNLQVRCSPIAGWKVFGEAWYQTAGVLNASVNGFGFFVEQGSYGK